MRLAAAVLGLYTVALLVQTLQHLVAPQRDGVLAIAQVGAPHLFLPLAVLLPVGLLVRRHRLVLALVVLATVVGLARFGPGMVALPASVPSSDVTVSVAAWNLAAGDAAPADLVDWLLASDAEIVALPELTPRHAAAIEASAQLVERFPHRLLSPNPSVLGMGLLSVHPAQERRRSTSPPHILADIELPGGTTAVVLAAHPLPPRFALAGGLVPLDYLAGDRDRDLAHLRSMFAHDLSAGRPVLVLGDLNVTDREIAYAAFTHGLVDAHRAVGIGPGSTWRPLRLAALPLGILRIDYVLTGGPLRPLSSGTECRSATGDHCILRATLALESQP